MLVVVLILSACGSNPSNDKTPGVSNQANQAAETTTQRKAVSATEFRSALNAVGYLEEEEFDAKYASIINSNGYDSPALYDAAVADGIVGYMYSDDDLEDIPGMRQYLYYELNNIMLEDGSVLYTWGDLIAYIVFNDEPSAISAVDLMKGEFEVSFTEKVDDHYSRLTAKEGNETAVIARVDNTCIVFMGTADCPAYRVFDILNY